MEIDEESNSSTQIALNRNIDTFCMKAFEGIVKGIDAAFT